MASPPPGLEPLAEERATEVVLVSANPFISKRLARTAPELQWYSASYADILRKEGLVLPDVAFLLLLDAASRSSSYCGRAAHVCTLLYNALQRCTERGNPTMIVARRHSHQEVWKRLLRRWKPYESAHCSCQYLELTGQPHIHFRVFTSGAPVKNRKCRCVDTSMSLSRRELDVVSARFVEALLTLWLPRICGECTLTDDGGDNAPFYRGSLAHAS